MQITISVAVINFYKQTEQKIKKLGNKNKLPWTMKKWKTSEPIFFGLYRKVTAFSCSEILAGMYGANRKEYNNFLVAIILREIGILEN